MNFLNERLAGRQGIDLIKEGILESEELCGWMDFCKYFNHLRKGEKDDAVSESIVREMGFCTSDFSKDCTFFNGAYKTVTYGQLEEISKMISDMDCKRAPVFLAKLPQQVYTLWLKHTLENGSEVFAEDNKRCLNQHGCSAREYYDTEHPSD